MPGSWVGYPYYSTSDFYEDIARIAERGVMDMLFFGDNGGTSEDYGGDHRAVVRYGAKWPRHDMTPMIPLLARVTSGVGYALTMSTTYHHPFHVARIFNALDHVTRGRIAWNAVTSAYKGEAANWGFDVMMDHDERYVRAQEHLEVVCALWDSVEPDALVLDRENGVFVDPDKVHRLDFRGQFFNVRGPLPALPSPQQRPLIIQAGSSGPGMDLAAKYAELQFSTRRTLSSMQQHRAAIDAKLAAFGRKPRDLGILWSIRIQVADSEEAAREKERRFLNSIPPEAGLIEMSQQFGVDFSTAKPGMRLRRLCRSGQIAEGKSRDLRGDTENDRTQNDGRGIRPRLHDQAHPGGCRHPESNRRYAREAALRDRRQWRLHSGPRISRHGQSPRICRSGRARTAAAGPEQEEIRRANAAREFQ